MEDGLSDLDLAFAKIAEALPGPDDVVQVVSRYQQALKRRGQLGTQPASVHNESDTRPPQPVYPNRNFKPRDGVGALPKVTHQRDNNPRSQAFHPAPSSSAAAKRPERPSGPTTPSKGSVQVGKKRHRPSQSHRGSIGVESSAVSHEISGARQPSSSSDSSGLREPRRPTKALKCPFCWESLSQQRDLTRHFNQICNQQQHWVCPHTDCNELSFKRAGRFDQHHTKVHNTGWCAGCTASDTVRDLPARKVIACGICDFVCTQNKDFASHLRKQHWSQGQGKDNWCDKIKLRNLWQHHARTPGHEWFGPFINLSDRIASLDDRAMKQEIQVLEYGDGDQVLSLVNTTVQPPPLPPDLNWAPTQNFLPCSEQTYPMNRPEFRTNGFPTGAPDHFIGIDTATRYQHRDILDSMASGPGGFSSQTLGAGGLCSASDDQSFDPQCSGMLASDLSSILNSNPWEQSNETSNQAAVRSHMTGEAGGMDQGSIFDPIDASIPFNPSDSPNMSLSADPFLFTGNFDYPPREDPLQHRETDWRPRYYQAYEPDTLQDTEDVLAEFGYSPPTTGLNTRVTTWDKDCVNNTTSVEAPPLAIGAAASPNTRNRALVLGERLMGLEQRLEPIRNPLVRRRVNNDDGSNL